MNAKGPNGIMPKTEEIAEWLYDSYGWDIEPARDFAELATNPIGHVTLPSGRVSNTFEAYLAWKTKAEKLEANNNASLEALQELQKGIYDFTELPVGAKNFVYRITSEAIRQAKEATQ